MIRKLGMRISTSNPIFIDNREGFRVTATVLQLLSNKVDELVVLVNKQQAEIATLKEMANQSKIKPPYR